MGNFNAKQLFFIGLASPFAVALLFILILNFKMGGFGGEEVNHIWGNKNAKVKLVEYSDFQCPYCEKAYPTLKRLREEYGNKISIEYRHFPLSFHQYAEKTAEASECAAEQGKFWQFHDKVFENQTKLNSDALVQWAGELKLNVTKFTNCLNSGKYAAKVAAEQNEGAGKGVNGTPTTFINDQPLVGAQPYEAFKAAIDKLLK